MRKLLMPVFILVFPAYILAACPSLNCPQDRDTPVAIYQFENNFLDSSGHNLTAGNNYAPAPVLYYANIGGNPGYAVGNFIQGSMTGVTTDACTIYRSEGEIEWSQYLTATVTSSSVLFSWINGTQELYIDMGDSYYGPDFVSVWYTYLVGSTDVVENYTSECLKLDTWQHFSFQWGDFGTRLNLDGVPILGSFNTWDQGPVLNDKIIRFGTNGTTLGFAGFLDDIMIWPCSSHGTQTPTITLTETTTYTFTQTPSITPTFTITETHTCTYSPTITETITPAYTVTYSPVLTFSCTPTISPTITITPTPSGDKFTGIYPNPARDAANIIFTCNSACTVKICIYTVSGEKINESGATASAGINSVTISTKNQNGSRLASGVYICRLELQLPGGAKEYLRGKFAVIK